MSPMDGNKILLSLQCRGTFKLWEIGEDLQTTESAEEPKVFFEVGATIKAAKVSPDGSHFIVNSVEGGLSLFKIFGAVERSVVKKTLRLPPHLVGTPALQLKSLKFSPRGTFLTAFYAASGHGAQTIEGDNFLIWDLNTGASEIDVCHAFRSLSDPEWTWRDDEMFRVSVAGGRVRLFRSEGFEKNSWSGNPMLCTSIHPRGKIELAPARASRNEDEVLMFAFTPADEATEKPGELIATLLNGAEGSVIGTAVKEFKSVDGCESLWSPSGERCLLMTSTLVDALGQNYGSVGDLWLTDPFRCARSHHSNDLECHKVNRQLTQDARWSDVHDEFIVIEGKSPSDIRLMDSEGRDVQTLPRGYRNKIIWNRQGSMVAIGGFGNLAGDLSFYFRDNDGRLKLAAEWREPCVVICDWSPCGNYFFVASTQPRLMVENQVKIFDRSGALLKHYPFEALYNAEWQSQPDASFPTLHAPTALKEAANASLAKGLYRPKGGDSSRADDTRLIALYLAGGVALDELPPRLQKNLGSNGGANKKTKNPKGQKILPDLPMDWRSNEKRSTAPPAAQTESEVPSSALTSLPPSSQPIATKEQPAPEMTIPEEPPIYVPRVAAPISCEPLSYLPRVAAPNPEKFPHRVLDASTSDEVPPATVLPAYMRNLPDSSRGTSVVEAGPIPQRPDVVQPAYGGPRLYPPPVPPRNYLGEGLGAFRPEYAEDRASEYMNWPNAYYGGQSGTRYPDRPQPPIFGPNDIFTPHPATHAFPPAPFPQPETAGMGMYSSEPTYAAAAPPPAYLPAAPYMTSASAGVAQAGASNNNISTATTATNQLSPHPERDKISSNEAATDSEGGEKVLSLLRMILPSTTKVHVNSSGGVMTSSSSNPAPVPDGGRDNLMNLMRRAGIMRGQEGVSPPAVAPMLPVATNPASFASVPSAAPPTRGEACRWLYIDPKGKLQGPFHGRQMRIWWERGYFRGSLLVRRENEGNEAFKPLGEIFPNPNTAFL